MQKHIEFDPEAMRLLLLDQRLLPNREAVLICQKADDVIHAIRSMAVRGAPAIGVAAAWGCVMAAWELPDNADWRKNLLKMEEIASARPTAVNLAWAVKRMAKKAAYLDYSNLVAGLISEAKAIQAEDLATCKAIGQAGASVIKDGDTILTHCNAGALATAGYGTALGVIRAAAEQGKKIRVIADETRPLLQGARLTAYELLEDNIPVTIACDNNCAHLFSQGVVQLAITGADRIAANGDTANKIGTLGIAIIASYFRIPFYIAAPLSTIDIDIACGQDIPIEERDQIEVLELNGIRIAPPGPDACNYAFDVTPAHLISGIITEKGILRPPYEYSISQALGHEKTDHLC